MFTVNKSQVDIDGTKLIAEASTLDLPPGEWPEFIAVVDDGNSGFLFQKGNVLRHGTEFAGFNYYTRDGRFTLVVFND